ncbi:MAG: hypothetical protein ACTHM5_21160 [Ginsengibacter sp.]
MLIPGAFSISSTTTFVIAYPPLPWLGIMLAGFATGKLFLLNSAKRKKIFFQLGLIGLSFFIIIRFINIYGDPAPWYVQKNILFTILSFLNVTKYPPSLQFCLLTLSVMFLIIAFAEGLKNKFNDFVIVYGKVPMFYFLVHFYLIHLIMFVMVYLQGFHSSQMVFGFNFGRPKEGSGVNLWIIYLIWLCVVIVLYPLCKWYGTYKTLHKEKQWLRYL